MKFSTPNPALAMAKAKAATQFLVLKRVLGSGRFTLSIEPFPLAAVLARRPHIGRQPKNA